MDYREFVAFSTLCNLSVRNGDRSTLEREEVLKQYQTIGVKLTLDLAQEFKMLPFIAKLLADAEMDVDVWLPIIQRYRDRNRRVLEELDLVYAQFHDMKIHRIFVTENFGATLSAGGDIGLFASGDVDNFAYISERNRIDAAFSELGYKKTDRHTGKLLISTTYEHQKRLPGGFQIGVEWFPLSRMTMPCFIDAEHFIDWERLHCFPETAVNLPPADALMYICLLHISLHSYSRAPAIRLYRDIVNASSVMSKADWNRIVAWAKRDKVCRRISTAAAIARKIGKIIIPDEVMNLSQGKNAKLLDLVYDCEHELLRPEPSRLDVLKIESMSFDSGRMRGFSNILFPDAFWMKQVYGGSGIEAHFQHLRLIL